MTSSWPDSATIGRRVVVRHRTGGTALSGRPELTDVIGYLREVDSELLRVEHRSGALITVQRADAVTWKTVPEPPPRRGG